VAGIALNSFVLVRLCERESTAISRSITSAAPQDQGAMLIRALADLGA
jgi:hypothetical protein